MTPETHSFQGARGTRIVYDVYEPEGPSRGLVLLVHGLGEHAGRYPHVARRLVGLGLRVAAPDHRGHGRSEGPRAGLRRWADLTDDLEQLHDLVATPDEPVFVVGHSMGGAIALDYALERQGRLTGLVLSAPAVLPGSDQGPLLIAVAKLLGRVAPGAPTLELDSSSVSRDPAVVAAYADDPLVFHGKVPAGLAGALLRTMQGFPARLPALELPLLVMQGGDDRLVNPAGSDLVDELAASPDKTVTVYDGLFHEIFNEPEQDAVLEQLTSWLAARIG